MGRPAEASVPVQVVFDRGTLELRNLSSADAASLPGVVWDPRTRSARAPAYRYADILSALGTVTTADPSITWPQPKGTFAPIELRPYQQAALDSWTLAGHRGIVVLPTGAGKTRVALAAIAQQRVSALCLVPTRVLLHQWQRALQRTYGAGVGALGDGSRSLRPITVATFESAYRYMHRFGGRFALLIVDEAHHFGCNQRDEALEMAVAPMRLGLTATPLRDAAALEACARLIGPEVFRLGVLDLSGKYLAELQVVRLELELSPAERERYAIESTAYREAFKAFMSAHPEASWSDFARAASASDSGRRALAAFRRARAIAHYTKAKSAMVGRLLLRHREGRCLVFTADNDGAYALAREHLVMPITCDIGHKERERAFELFREGELRALVSARVLNEGVDLPEADVAIIVGGNHGEREHVQRIGRVLRPAAGKRALVYELVSRETDEVRRAQHRSRSLGEARAL